MANCKSTGNGRSLCSNSAMNQICKGLRNWQSRNRYASKVFIDEDKRPRTTATLWTFDKVLFQSCPSLGILVFPSLQSLFTYRNETLWATMAAFSESLTDEWVGAFMESSLLSWAARNNTKPGRNTYPEHLVLHATPDWSDQNWEASPEEVTKKMLADFWKVSGIEPRKPSYCTAHRWRYAIPAESSKAATYTLDKSKNIFLWHRPMGRRGSIFEWPVRQNSYRQFQTINEFEDNQGL